jgi:hypothetical protein
VQTNFLKNNPLGTLATVLAGATAAMAASSANATIVSDTTPFSVGSSTPVGSMTGVTIESSRVASTDKNNVQRFADSVQIFSGTGGVTGSTLAAGTLIGPSSSFLAQANIGTHQPTYVYSFGQMYVNHNSTGSGSGLYGVQFDNGAGARYGWLDVAITNNGINNPFSATVNGYGYENSGAAIAAGALAAAPVPEPETLSMMALGLMGIAAARRRQRTAQARRAH